MVATIHLSLLADLILGGMLIFLWLMRRGDRHALYWGSAQILLAVAAAVWSLRVLELWASVLIIGAGTLGMVCHVAGTLLFCGKPILWRRQALGWITYACVQTLIAAAWPRLSHGLSLLTLGAVLAWCGWQLSRRKHPYKLLAITLWLRAATNVVFSLNMLMGTHLEGLFAIGFVLKLLASFGLIHAILADNQRRIFDVLNGLGHGFLIRDADGIVRFASEKLALSIGLAGAKEMVGQHITSLAYGRSKEEGAAWFQHVTAPDAPRPCIDEVVHQHRDGREVPLEVISVPFEDRGELHVLSQVIDISERKALEATRQRAAMLDDSTGLLNRFAFRQMLGDRLAASRGQDEVTIVLLIDIDHFKRVNDTLGHTVGDTLIKRVATRLQQLQLPHLALARFGGDEFALMFTEADPATAHDAAERFARAILLALHEPIPLSSFRISIKASIGIAFAPAHGLDPESVLSAADAAVYAAKDRGRNRHEFFDVRMGAKSRDALLIEEALQQAIANNEFQLVYQPIVDARSRRLVKVEALLRWRTPTLGFVGPDRFIPIAEDNGQIISIGTWVVQEAARQARAWHSRPEGPIRIAVNVSAAQLVDPDFIDVVDRAIADAGAAPTELEIEMTERVLINEADTVVRVIDTLHEKGLSTSLDDFGTGYSSLSYLTRFHLRTLKIDRAFVNCIDQDERSLALVRAIIAMGHSLGMSIVAEGVETENQARILAELGCEYLQGYLFSPPVPAEKLIPNASAA